MTATAANTSDETARKINRAVIKYVIVRVTTGVAITVAGSLIANALDRKLNDDSIDENPENN